MFTKHVTKELSAYCHDELPAPDARRIAEHLLCCQSCRKRYEEIKFGVCLAEQLPPASAPPSLWKAIESRLEEQPRHAAAQPYHVRFAFAQMWQPLAATSIALLLISVIGIGWYYSRRQHQSAPQVVSKETAPALNSTAVTEPSPVVAPTVAEVQKTNDLSQTGTKKDITNLASRRKIEAEPARQLPRATTSWTVARLDGAPKVGADRISNTGRLAVGEWVETDSASRAKIQVADIGQVELDPNSRIQLVKTRSTEHRLALQRGRMHAMILAPPRLFFVDTPSGVAVDYGCAYTLEVDHAGNSRLHVTAGWVALELQGREAMVPAGAVCTTRPRVGPGTPYFEDASPALRAALEKFDSNQRNSTALEVVLGEARARDTLTLWHLLSRVDDKERGRVYDRLVTLIPAPSSVTRDGVLRLDQKMLRAWREELEAYW